MSLVDDIYSEVETLRGLLTALMVNFPGLGKERLDMAIAVCDRVLRNPSEESIAVFIEDIQDLEVYFKDVLKMISDVHLDRSIRNILELTGKLLGPEEKYVEEARTLQ